MDIFKGGEITVSICSSLSPFLKRIYSFRVDLFFQKGTGKQESKQEVTKVVSLNENGGFQAYHLTLTIMVKAASSKKVSPNMHKVRRLRSSCTCAKCHPGLCSLLIDSEVPIEDLLAESVGPDQTAQTLFRMANSVDPDQTPQNATQFALNTGISIKHGNTNQADSPSIGKRTCPKS